MKDKEAITILRDRVRELKDAEVDFSVSGKYSEAGEIRAIRKACELGLKALEEKEENSDELIIEFTPEETIENIIDDFIILFNKVGL
jgi:hypothetical protein